MLYCNSCRLNKRWPTPRTYPFGERPIAECEICHQRKECFDYPAIYAKPASQLTTEEKLLDRAFQNEYHQKSESMVITFVSGPRAGAVDTKATENLRKTFRYFDNKRDIDWYATYELRRRLQDGYAKVEHR